MWIHVKHSFVTNDVNILYKIRMEHLCSSEYGIQWNQYCKILFIQISLFTTWTETLDVFNTTLN